MRSSYWVLGIGYWVISSLLVDGRVAAQDIHYSQFYSSPLTLNPALTGAFEGQYRFVGNERRQWGSITLPYVYETFGLSAEMKQPFKALPDFAAGLAVYRDKAGDSEFGTLQINLSGAYSIRMNSDSTQFLTIGLQSGMTQRKINYNKLTFDEQWNGYKYDGSLDGNETFDREQRLYSNLNLGLSYRGKFGERNAFLFGASWFNITKPTQSFYSDNIIKLDRRLHFHATAKLKMAEKFDLIPGISGMGQGTYREYLFGTNLKHIMSNEPYKYRAVYFGGWLRYGDAGYLMVGMDYNTWHVGLSYDFNYSNLRPASLGRGGFEIAVIYILRNLLPERVPYKVCPAFI